MRPRQNLLTLLFALLSSPMFGVTVSISMDLYPVCTYPTGSISANADGGIPPYTYLWNTGSTEAWLSDIPAGTYSVTVTDANSEEATAQFELTAFPLEAYLDSYAACPGGVLGPPFRMFGQANIYSVGVPPLVLQGGFDHSIFSGGPGGLEALYVATFDTWPAAGTQLSIPFTDANGCPGTIYGDVPAPPAFPDVAVLSVDAACAGGNNGGALVQVGEAPNDHPYHVRLVHNGNAFGDLEYLYSFGQLFGQTQQTIQRQDLPPGDFMLVTTARFIDPFEWLESYLLPLDNSCADTTWFTVPELPGPCATLRGTAYMDDNQNCTMAANEVRVPQAVMAIEPGGYSTLTNATGFYQINLPTGSYTVEQVSAEVDEHCVGGAIPIDLANSGQVVTQNMADTALTTKDVSIMIASGFARPGFQYDVSVLLRHETPGGTGAVTVSFTYDPALGYIGATPTPTTVNGNTLTWNQSQLTSFAQRSIQIDLQVPPDPGLLGTDLVHTATVSIAQPEPVLNNNTTSHTRTVTGSYDPNDKTATTSSGGSDAFWIIDEDEWIDYTIRFQNTGTDTAFHVLITDTLPTTLDASTFQLGPRTHGCIPQLTGQGILRFSFPNILLPDSNVNEPASHGFVSFRIRPELPVLPGTTIENIANIYFDFNPPVITEPSVLVAEFSTGVESSASLAQLQLMPNPASGVVRIRLQEHTIQQVSLIAMDGRVAAHFNRPGEQIDLDLSAFSSGCYMVEVRDEYNAVHRRKLMITKP